MELREKIEIKRHKELRDGLTDMKTLLSNFKNDDPELKKLIAENSEAINNFVSRVSELSTPKINVETNQEKVILALSLLATEMGEIMKGINERITSLEQRPLPIKIRPQRGYDGTIDYVIIEYKK